VAEGSRRCYAALMRFDAVVTKEDALYVARCLQVEVTSQGDNEAEALANLREALELYFEDVPAPNASQLPVVLSLDIAV
jgi:predicted RNase H-like HicB family nuclease